MASAVAEDILNEPVMQLVTFRLDDETYGINVMHVQEVLRVSEIAPVPGSDSWVLGIINLRGNVVTVIDTRLRFGLPTTEMSDSSRIVIIDANAQAMGILVDSVAEVVELPESEVEIAPVVNNDDASRYILGVASRQEDLLIVVDVNKMLDDSAGGGDASLF